MRRLLPHSITTLVLLLCACADRQPTRPEREGARPSTPPNGQLSDVATIQDAPTPSADVTITGRALGCFGTGCTPTNLAFTLVNGITISYASSFANTTFSGTTANGVLAVNGSNLLGLVPGNFGQIVISPFTIPFQTTALSIPFTLQLTFSSPTASAVTISATLRGAIAVPPLGGVLLTFDEKKTVGSETIRIDFIDPNTNTPGRMNLTLFGEPIPVSQPVIIGGFFEIR
jgi:hypothetical protein